MEQQKKLALFLVLILLVIFAIIYIVKLPNFKKLTTQLPTPPQLGSTISPDILSLTSPIYSLTGVVEKVEGNTLTISYQNSREGATNKKLVYKVLITDKTTITSPLSQSGIHLPGEATFSSPNISYTIKNIRVGESAAVGTATDLRQLTTGKFEASTVVLVSRSTSLEGTITQIDGQTLIIHTATNKDYRITVNKQTMISQIVDGSPRAEAKLLTLGNLKPEMVVAVTTNNDLAETTVAQALRIEVLALTSR